MKLRVAMFCQVKTQPEHKESTTADDALVANIEDLLQIMMWPAI